MLKLNTTTQTWQVINSQISHQNMPRLVCHDFALDLVPSSRNDILGCNTAALDTHRQCLI